MWVFGIFFLFLSYSIPGVEMAPSGSWTSAPKEAFIIGLKELPESEDPVTHKHIFYAHAYKVSCEFISLSHIHCVFGEQGWCSGESTCLPPMWSRFNSWAWRHMWVKFVVGSHPWSEGFSLASLVFLPPQKSTLLNSNSIWKQWMKSHFLEMPVQIPIYFILLAHC